MSSLDPCVHCKQDPGQEERAPSDGFNMLSIICAAHSDAVISSNVVVK